MAYLNGKRINIFHRFSNLVLQKKTATENGTVSPDSGYDGLSSVLVSVPSIEDVSTAAALTAKLVAANVGNVYRFTGTTDDTYTNGDLYEVVSES